MEYTAVYRSPGPCGPYDEKMFSVDGTTVTEHRWRWLAPREMTPTTKHKTAFRSADEAVASLAGWRPVTNWPEGKSAPRRLRPFPDPMRKQGTMKEQQLLLDGDRVIVRSWTLDGDVRRGDVFKIIKHRSEPAALAAIVLLGRKLNAEGWGKPTKTKTPAVAAKPKPPTKRKPPKPVKLSQLKLEGTAKRATQRELDAIGGVPADWAELVRTRGGRTFAKRLRFRAADKVVAFTKKWLGWRIDHWANFGELVPDRAKLVIIADSIDGDQVGFVRDVPGYLIFGRDEDVVIRVRSLGELLGWVLEINEGAGDPRMLTYGPESA